MMKRIAILLGVGLFMSLPSLLMAQDHGEVGAFAEYMRFTPTNSTMINFLGAGARVGVNVHRAVSLEAEMSYDFARDTTTTYNNGGNTSFSTTGVRPLLGLFGPKFEIGTHSARIFVTGKAGFINFSTDNSGNVNGGSVNTAFNTFGGNGTHVAFYPGGGVETFLGPVGLRAEAGDEIYLNNGTYNNLRVTFGPEIRF